MHYVIERSNGTTASFDTHNGVVTRTSEGMFRLLSKGIDSALQMLAEQPCVIRVSEYPAGPSTVVQVSRPARTLAKVKGSKYDRH